MNREELQRDLASVINKHSLDSGCDTPDFILAEYLVDMLLANIQMKLATSKWEVPEQENDG